MAPRRLCSSDSSLKRMDSVDSETLRRIALYLGHVDITSLAQVSRRLSRVCQQVEETVYEQDMRDRELHALTAKYAKVRELRRVLMMVDWVH